MLRIAQVAPLVESVPPTTYGGIERIIHYLTDALVDLGCDVTVFASRDSHTRGRLVPCRDQALRLDPERSDALAATLLQFMAVRNQASGFDILHFHHDTLHIPLFREQAHKTITTLHSRLDIKDYPRFYRTFPEFPLIAISSSQRNQLPAAGWRRTIPHGLPETLYRQGTPDQTPYLAFLGRFAADKGFEHAVAIAERAGLPLKAAAKRCAEHPAYFEDVVAPLLKRPHVEYLGEVDDAGKQELLGGALALLFPIAWPEPFGLVMIEAMACGTPVIAFDQGAVPEVIETGLTGFITRTCAEAVAAIPQAANLNRNRIRRRFEERFTTRRMAEAYLRVYQEQKLLGESLLERAPIPARRTYATGLTARAASQV
jgi:glycosyltransferase involved in cell wall biosynthesis